MSDRPEHHSETEACIGGNSCAGGSGHAGPPSRRLDRLLKSKEIAQRLRIPESSVLLYARNGTIPYVRIGRHYRFDWADVVRAIDDLKDRR